MIPRSPASYVGFFMLRANGCGYPGRTFSFFCDPHAVLRTNVPRVVQALAETIRPHSSHALREVHLCTVKNRSQLDDILTAKRSFKKIASSERLTTARALPALATLSFEISTNSFEILTEPRAVLSCAVWVSAGIEACEGMR